MYNLPPDIVRYQLLSFLNLTSAVQLARTSQAHFHSLRHRIHNTEHVPMHRFIQQSHAQSQHIGLCSSVMTEYDLTDLIRHIADDRIIKMVPLLRLILGDKFDRSLAGVTLPVSLLHLEFGDFFNQSLVHVTLPTGLQTLRFGFLFDQSFDDVALPESLLHLDLGWCFNKSLASVKLPASLLHLYLGSCFNQSLADVKLPANLLHLGLGRDFDKALDDVKLPAGLRTHTLGHFFYQSLVAIAFPHNIVISKHGLQLAAHLLPPGLHIVNLHH